MSATTSRALRPAVGPGTLLAGRYRLEQAQHPLDTDPAEAQRWSALDDVLARRVDVVVLPAHGRRAAWARDLLQAAAAAGTVPSPVLAAVYDAAIEEVPAERYGRAAGTVDVAYVVTEQVPGAPLGEVVASDGPLEPDDALRRVLGALDGLRAVHERGLVHGGISPQTAVLTDDGLRLRDTGIAGALARRAEEAEPARTPADDVAALTACLYALLTGRWPQEATVSPAAGLPPAPRTAGRTGRLCSPRQVRAGVPRHLDEVVLRALEGPDRPATAEQLARRLQAAAGADAAARAPAPRRQWRRPDLPPGLARALPSLLVVLLLVLVGITGFVRGRALGTLEDRGGELERLVDSTPAPVPGDDDGSGGRVDLAGAGVVVRAFDPPPGDGRENDAAVPNAIDGDAGTAWETERYDTSRLGGIKAGVGLLVDLGEPVTLEQVEIGLAPGTDVELRTAPPDAETASGFQAVAREEDTGDVARLVPEKPVTARFVVVWLTRLPEGDGGFRGVVRELFLVRA